MVTTFKPTEQSQDKYKRNSHGTDKIPNVTMKTERLGTMLICSECGKDWNYHAPRPQGKVPAGMCLTEANFKLTNTYLVEG